MSLATTREGGVIVAGGEDVELVRLEVDGTVAPGPWRTPVPCSQTDDLDQGGVATPTGFTSVLDLEPARRAGGQLQVYAAGLDPQQRPIVLRLWSQPAP